MKPPERTFPTRPAAAVLLILAAAASGTLAAQEVDTPRFEGEVEVTEVLLDVVVTDRDGNMIAGLERSDFIVEEDGLEMELTGADFYTTRYGGAGAEGGEFPASRYFILFFDDTRLVSNRLNRLVQQQQKAARDAQEWIEQELQPSDWVAVAGWGMKLKVFQDFTQNRKDLVQAVTDASRGINPEKKRWTQEPTAASAPSLLRHLPSGKELSKKTRRVYSGLELLAEATGHIVGRKNLLYFGIGFGQIDDFSGAALPDRRYYPAMERALNDNNVAVYPIDLTVVAAWHAQSEFLNKLAHDTGGRYYRNLVSFVTPLRAIANENIGFYLLSYRSEHPKGEAGYQKIRVGARIQNVIVRAQRGYRFGDTS